MKINDLINQLKELKKKYGNQNIRNSSCGNIIYSRLNLEYVKNEILIDGDNDHEETNYTGFIIVN